MRQRVPGRAGPHLPPEGVKSTLTLRSTAPTVSPGERPYHRRVTPAPIQALHLIREDDAGDTESTWDPNLERISLDPAGDRTKQREADLAVVRGRRQHNSGTTSCLLPSGLRVEIDPDGIPTLRERAGERSPRFAAHGGTGLDLAMDIVVGSHAARRVVQLRTGSLQHRDHELLTLRSQLDCRVQRDAYPGSDGLRNSEREAVAPTFRYVSPCRFSPNPARRRGGRYGVYTWRCSGRQWVHGTTRLSVLRARSPYRG